MKSLKTILAAATLAALAACSNTPAPAQPAQSSPASAPAVAAQPTDPLADLKAFTLADLQAASADAHANNDATAYQCYDFLAKVLPTLPTFQPGSTVGAVLAFQKLRDLQSGLQSQQGALKSLDVACAPLVIDTQTTINRLALIGAGAYATGGAAVPLLGVLP